MDKKVDKNMVAKKNKARTYSILRTIKQRSQVLKFLQILGILQLQKNNNGNSILQTIIQ